LLCLVLGSRCLRRRGLFILGNNAMVGHPFFPSRADGKEKGGTLRAKWWAVATTATLVLLLASTVEAAGPSCALCAVPSSYPFAGCATYSGVVSGINPLQQAVNAASPGSYIYAEPGIYGSYSPGGSIYGPALIVGIDNLTLVGLDASGVPADGTGDVVIQSTHTGWSNIADIKAATGNDVTPTSGTPPVGVIVVASGVSISGFSIYRPITGLPTSGLNVPAVLIGGLFVGDTNYATAGTVNGNTVSGNAMGVSGNEVWQGVYIIQSDNNVIADNVVKKSAGNHWAAISIDDGSSTPKNASQGNEILDNVLSHGIWVGGNTAVTDNSGTVVSGNATTVIKFTYSNSANVVISGNTVDGAGGIYLNDAGTSRLTNLTVAGNTLKGRGDMYFKWLDGASIHDNSSSGCGWDALAVLSSTNVDIYSNVFENSTNSGILLQSSSSVEIWDNALNGNKKYGINVGAGVIGVIVHDNVLAGNVLAGIYNATVTPVTATNNWWGAASGPGTVGSGTGDKVTANVTYNPWYVDTAMTTLSNVAPTNVYVNSTYVDGSAGGHAFGYDAFTTIQAGINAVATGGTVNVAAGVYDEQVYITKALTVQGAGDTTIIKPSAVGKLAQVITYVHTAPATNATFRSIVAVSAGGADVSLKSLKVDGASITNLTGYAASYYTGVVYFDTGGLIDHVTVANVLKVTGCTYANGIHATTSVEVIGGLEVANCTVSNSGGNNIILDSTDPVASGSPNSIVGNVHHNTIVGRGSQTDWLQNGIQFAAYNEGAGKSGVSGTIDHNTISALIWGEHDGWTSSGILTWATPTGPVITNNTITNSDVGICAGIANDSGSPASISSNTISGVSIVEEGGKMYAGIQLVADGDNRVTVDSNVIGSGYNYAGINFEDYGTGNTTRATVSNNTLTVGGTGDGILDSFTGTGSVIATVSGNSISNWANGIHILSTAPVAGYTISWNSIAGNATGINASSLSGNVDATDNYWGSASGPSGGLADPVTGTFADGTGDKVSANVLFDPWTGMSTTCVVTEPGQRQGDTVDNACADTSLNIVEAPGGGTTDVTIALYTSPPPDTPSFGASATYVDIQLSNPAAVTQMIITFTDMSPGTVIYFYRPGTGWVRCSSQTQAGTTITVTVTASTTPTLAELTGTIFAGGTGVPVVEYTIGDVSGNGVIDVLDVRLCLQIATGFLAGTPAQRAAADVDGDGDVDLADAEILAEYIIGIRTELGRGTE
jgi:hypothetical protein